MGPAALSGDTGLDGRQAWESRAKPRAGRRGPDW